MLNKDYLLKLSYLDPASAEYIDELFEKYLENPDSIDSTWRYLFDGMGLGTETGAYLNGNGQAVPDVRPTGQTGLSPAEAATAAASIASKRDLSSEAKVAELITMYRSRGWLLANLDPLNPPTRSHPILELANFGLTEADLDRTFTA